MFKHSVLDTLSEVCGGATWPHEVLHFQVSVLNMTHPAGRCFLTHTLVSPLVQFENWSLSSDVGGSGGAPRLASMGHFHSLRQPHGRIHLAGAETSVRHLCSAAGAVDSGRRAALQVLAVLRPQALSTADYAALEASRVERKEELVAREDGERALEKR